MLNAHVIWQEPMLGDRRTRMHWTKHCTTNIHPFVRTGRASGTQFSTFETPKSKMDKALVTETGANHDAVLQVQVVGRRLFVD